VGLLEQGVITMNVNDIEFVLFEINETLKPLLRQKSELEQKLSKAKSLEWISVNKLTVNDVENSRGESKPWFGTVNSFGEWLSENSRKPYCEWNGLIYETKRIIDGFMDREVSGRFEDLPS